MEKYEWTEDFEKDIFTMVNVISAVFNGKVIVFEIQTR